MKTIATIASAAAIGFAMLTGAASAAPAGLAGPAPAAVKTVPVEQANHQRGRGGASIEFHFGSGPGYRYGPPRYVPPRYGPRYHQRRYGPPRHYRPAASAHVRWCSAQYRSYRASDNTFQPFNGPRRQCRSPYF